MRQRDNIVVPCFLKGQARCVDTLRTDGVALYYHGNKIAWHEPNGVVALSLAGWPTVTTRVRLNAVLHFLNHPGRYHQKKKVQYFDDMEIGDREVVRIHDIWRE